MEGLTEEQKQEQLLKEKMSNHGGMPPKPASSFLQKKLLQRKFFDSGDYNMNKEQEKKHLSGNEHPLSQSCNQPLKTTITTTIQEPTPQLAHSPKNQNELDAISEDALTVPTPENVPQRKSSILFPDALSKLTPAPPHIHHEQTQAL
uniref:Alpha-endosulfine n=1 Tax=Rhabditophanes sp. KR3021 TaxID=114890 RepID=A0AC35THH1_9BILA